MGFPRPSLNVVLDSISLTLRCLNLRGEITFLHHHLAASILWRHGVTSSVTLPKVSKPRSELRIIDTRIGLTCLFRNVVIDSIIPISYRG